jgi:hypothetical protein
MATPPLSFTFSSQSCLSSSNIVTSTATSLPSSIFHIPTAARITELSTAALQQASSSSTASESLRFPEINFPFTLDSTNATNTLSQQNSGLSGQNSLLSTQIITHSTQNSAFPCKNSASTSTTYSPYSYHNHSKQKQYQEYGPSHVEHRHMRVHPYKMYDSAALPLQDIILPPSANNGTTSSSTTSQRPIRNQRYWLQKHRINIAPPSPLLKGRRLFEKPLPTLPISGTNSLLKTTISPLIAPKPRLLDLPPILIPPTDEELAEFATTANNTMTELFNLYSGKSPIYFPPFLESCKNHINTLIINPFSNPHFFPANTIAGLTIEIYRDGQCKIIPHDNTISNHNINQIKIIEPALGRFSTLELFTMIFNYFPHLSQVQIHNDNINDHKK